MSWEINCEIKISQYSICHILTINGILLFSVTFMFPPQMTPEYPENTPRSTELISLQRTWLRRQWATLSSGGNWATVRECDSICALREGSVFLLSLNWLLYWLGLCLCPVCCKGCNRFPRLLKVIRFSLRVTGFYGYMVF